MNLSRWTNQDTTLDLRTLVEIEIAVNLFRQVLINWNSSYKVMDKFTIISIFVRLDLKQ